MRRSDKPWPSALAAVRHQAEALGNIVRALEELAALRKQHGGDVELQYHASRILAWLATRLEPHHAPDRLAQRLGLPLLPPASQGQRGPSANAPVGVCSGVLIDVDGSGAGFISELAIEARTEAEAEFSPGMGAGFRRSVRDAAAATLRHVVDRAGVELGNVFRRRERCVLRGPPAARSLVADGRSFGAAAAVAFASRWCNLAPAPGTFVIGALDRGGKVTGVAGLEEKIATVLRERPIADRILVPADCGQAAQSPVVPVRDIGQLFDESFGTGAVRRSCSARLDVELAVRRGVELYEKHNNFEATAVVMQAALEAIAAQRSADDPRFRVEELTALWRLGSSLTHQGRVRQATEVFDRADRLAAALWDARVLSPDTYLGYRGTRAVLLRDTYQYAAAEASLRETLELQQRMRQSLRAEARTLGNLGELLTFMDRFDEAQTVLRRALRQLETAYPEEVPRAHCNLGNLALRRRDAPGALAAFERGLETNQGVERGQRSNESFLRYGKARALLALADADGAHRSAHEGLDACRPDAVYPRRLLELCQGLCYLQRGQQQLGAQRLFEAAELSGVDGDLLRFGLSTALGHLALARLDAGCLWDDTTAGLVRRLARTAQQVPGLAAASGLGPQIDGLLDNRITPDAGLARVVMALIRWFPYGVDPWAWRRHR